TDSGPATVRVYGPSHCSPSPCVKTPMSGVRIRVGNTLNQAISCPAPLPGCLHLPTHGFLLVSIDGGKLVRSRVRLALAESCAPAVRFEARQKRYTVCIANVFGVCRFSVGCLHGL